MKLYTGNGTGTDNAFNLKTDGEFIYTTGPTMTSMKKKVALGIPLGVEIQVFVQKYTMNGELVWTQLCGGPEIEYCRGLAVDDKYIFVSASTKSYVEQGGKDNTLLLKIDKQTGKLVTQRTWGGLGTDGVTTSIAQDSHRLPVLVRKGDIWRRRHRYRQEFGRCHEGEEMTSSRRLLQAFNPDEIGGVLLPFGVGQPRLQ
jgi:hypothetical protein